MIIYVLNLPDLSITPDATKDGTMSPAKIFSSLTASFNNELNSKIASIVNSNSSYKYNVSGKPQAHVINIEKFFNTIVDDKCIKIGNTSYPFKDVTHSACDFSGPNALLCIPNKAEYLKGKYTRYLFAGQVHPTSYTHFVLYKYIDAILSGSKQINLQCTNL